MMSSSGWPKPVRALMAALATVLLVGCGSFSKDQAITGDDANKLYADAKADLENGSWDRAIKGFERVEAVATGTLLGQQAMLDLAYVQWRGGERAAALATLDRFVKLHPSSPAFDYALYLRGIVNFNDNLGMFGSLSGQQLSERDQRASRESYQAFGQLVQQYPNSRYAPDARLRMDYIVNSLAEYETHVARYYYRRGAYVAAANRAKVAVTEFEQSPAAEEALVIMVLSYDRLGLTELRDDSERVLRKNFPNSPYLASGDLRAPAGPWWRPW
jgi:outer membrane protein assembly factor BamD